MQTTSILASICNSIDKICRHFIWGYNDDKGGMHLMSWDKVCTPKSESDLGIKKASLVNIPLLINLGWSY